MPWQLGFYPAPFLIIICLDNIRKSIPASTKKAKLRENQVTSASFQPSMKENIRHIETNAAWPPLGRTYCVFAFFENLYS